MAYLGWVFALYWFGVFLCRQTARYLNQVDPGIIVFDEIIGFLIAMFLVPAQWQTILIGFVIFRTFDILKPYPIKRVEHKLGLGNGIMFDDIVAGIYTCLLMHLFALPLLG
nr:phosphatidylglycerophosphatase A [Vibrio variabilis]